MDFMAALSSWQDLEGQQVPPEDTPQAQSAGVDTAFSHAQAHLP